jgi:tripartite-type tricarboxylate transporter receptor subunit TctC
MAGNQSTKGLEREESGMKFPHRRQFLHLAAGAAALPVLSPVASAQTYPARPITLVVPFAAGGASDVLARIVSEQMSRTLGQRIVIENAVGAGGTTGSIRVMRASPDGYTILIGHVGTHAASVAPYPNLGYKPEVDFAPIGVVGIFAFVVAGRKSLPPNNATEFAAYVKANGQKLNVAHAGIGSVTHFTCLLLNSLLGAKPTLVPFSGAAPSMNAILAEQVDYMCVAVPDVAQHIQSGAVKAYAVGSPERSPFLPTVPSAPEVGLAAFQVPSWNGLFAPRGTPNELLDKLADALDKALDDETTRKRLTDIGCEIPSKAQRGQEKLATLVKEEIARYTPIIKAAGFSMQ